MASGEVTVRLLGLGLLVCAERHRTVWPDGFATEAAQALDDMLLVSARRGVARRRDHCGSCGSELTLYPRHTDTPVPVDTGHHVVTIVVEAPMHRCPSCGREQLDQDARAAVRGALDAAVTRATADEPR